MTNALLDEMNKQKVNFVSVSNPQPEAPAAAEAPAAEAPAKAAQDTKAAEKPAEKPAPAAEKPLPKRPLRPKPRPSSPSLRCYPRAPVLPGLFLSLPSGGIQVSHGGRYF